MLTERAPIDVANMTVGEIVSTTSMGNACLDFYSKKTDPTRCQPESEYVYCDAGGDSGGLWSDGITPPKGTMLCYTQYPACVDPFWCDANRNGIIDASE